MNFRYWLLGLGVLLCLTGTARASRTQSIDIDDFFYSDPVDTVVQHSSVQWTVIGFATHTTTSTPAQTDSWDSGFMGTGASFAHQFNKVGTFTYRCGVHVQMTGKVVVIGATPVRSATWGSLRKAYRKGKPQAVTAAK